ncbi:Uncharacterized protein APZ42_014089 [Daphnia magna]|uniref:CxC3 like cysteine cluster domain-containing protein n=1 Tax=Daphnia magna TaxID=35525 RepID=A0A162Q8W1_9CRUS|nr:Uncharacterized protein APZ42_014089 [Daphnia magna]
MLRLKTVNIPIPLYEPPCCNSCFSLGSIRLSCAGPTNIGLDRNSNFMEEDLLSFWHQLRPKTPGTCERKFVETLELIS